MKQGFTKVCVILDRSGSMESIRNAMISGVNEFVEGLKKQDGECEVLAIQFDSQDPYEILFNKPLKDVPQLTRDVYVPRGSTPLIDAMGYTIDNVGKELAYLREEDRPEHVVVLIVTDGEENASQVYGSAGNKSRIAQMVKHQQEEYKWVFMFMGANQDAVLVAQEYNIPQYSTLTFAASDVGARVTNAASVNFVNAVRSGSSGAVAGASAYSQSVRDSAMDTDNSWGSLQQDDTSNNYQPVSKTGSKRR